MRLEEFLEVGEHLTALWPSCVLTKEQVDVWFSRLKYFTVDECKKGLNAQFAESQSTSKVPKLEEVRKRIWSIHGAVTNTGPYTGEPDEPDSLPEMRGDVENFLTIQERETWKRLILKHEPWTYCFAKHPVTNAHWISLIHSRAIRERCEVPLGDGEHRRWTTVSTEQLWGVDKKTVMEQEPDPLEGLV